MPERTESRKKRIQEVLLKRQKDLTLIMDNIHDPHNVSAILRSCDAFGVNTVHLYYTRNNFPQIGRKSSASANKWVQGIKHTRPETLFPPLKEMGYQIAGTGFSKNAVALPEWDLTRPSAILLGNEHSGISKELRPHLDHELYIPMCGMVQSFNVSVAAAIILYEAWRQRQGKGMYERPAFDQETLERMYQEWEKK